MSCLHILNKRIFSSSHISQTPKHRRIESRHWVSHLWSWGLLLFWSSNIKMKDVTRTVHKEPFVLSIHTLDIIYFGKPKWHSSNKNLWLCVNTAVINFLPWEISKFQEWLERKPLLKAACNTLNNQLKMHDEYPMWK